jgi:hypothetical protein
MIRTFLFVLLLASPALASTEAYFRPHETIILVRGVADDRDAVDLFLAMKAPVTEIGNMWRKEIRVDGAFNLVCRASLITKALGICTLKMAPGVSALEVAGIGEKLENSITTRDGRLNFELRQSGALAITYLK